jgi:streptogramin lyase
MWFLDTDGPGLVKMTMTGATTEYPLPTTYFYEANPIAISVGPNSKFYILTCNKSPRYNIFGAIEVVNTSGHPTSIFQLPYSDVLSQNCNPESLATGTDGNAWFAGGGSTDRITPAGVITRFPYSGGAPVAITNGPNGDLWFKDGENIYSIDPTTTTIDTFPIPDSSAQNGNTIIAPADGNLWFACNNCSSGYITRMTPGGSFTFLPNIFPDGGKGVMAGAVGPGGWPYFFWNFSGNQPQVLRASTSSFAQTLIPSPYGDDVFSAATLGPDGNIWATTSDGHVIVYITRILTATPASLNFSKPGVTLLITGKETGNPILTATSSNVGIATVAVTPTVNVFAVTSHAVGYCTITIKDSKGNSFQVSVTVQ